MPVFDALYGKDNIKLFHAKHEVNAAHMAQGYARATNRPGVVLTTSGPGATNLVTALCDAAMDGTPIVAFCGAVPTAAEGSDAFQEAPICEIVRPMIKETFRIRRVEQMPRMIHQAFTAAKSGRPGPVLVELPKDTQTAVMEAVLPDLHPTESQNMMSSELDDTTLARTAQLINNAKRPVIYAGQGVLQSADGPAMLKELVEKTSIPVTTTMQGLGCFDELDDRALHMLGMHGSCYANLAVQHADVIVALGARFDDRVTGNVPKFAPAARQAALEGRGGIVHVDILSSNIAKVVPATIGIHADVGTALKGLLPLLQPTSIEQRSMWFDQIGSWKKQYPWEYNGSNDKGLKPQAIIKALSDMLEPRKEDAVITTGVGQHQMFAAQFFRWRSPGSWISSGGLGTMGFGLPAAIGAKIALPEKLVINIDGDASLNMSLTELSTTAQYKIGVKTLLLNNNTNGMVRQWQSTFYDKRYIHCDQLNPDFIQLSHAMGIKAERLEHESDIEKKLKWLLYDTGSSPALLEVAVNKEEHVLPFVGPGKALDEFISFQESSRSSD